MKEERKVVSLDEFVKKLSDFMVGYDLGKFYGKLTIHIADGKVTTVDIHHSRRIIDIVKA